jgi:hypothetical protein
VTGHNGPKNKKENLFTPALTPAVGSLEKQFSSVRGCDVCVPRISLLISSPLAAIGLSINFECGAQDAAEEMFQRVQLFQPALGGHCTENMSHVDGQNQHI